MNLAAASLRSSAQALARCALAARVGMRSTTGVGLLRLATSMLRDQLASGIPRAGIQGWLLVHPHHRQRSAVLLRRRLRLLAAAERAICRLDSGTTPLQVAGTLAVLARCSITQSIQERGQLRPSN